MSARERADKIIALLYNGGMADIINNLLERVWVMVSGTNGY